MPSLSYPKDVPVEDIKELVNMLLGKTPADTPTALQCGWIVQGYLQNLIIGAASAAAIKKVKFSSKASAKLTDKDAFLVLQTLAGKGKAKDELKAKGLVGDLLGGGALKIELAKLLLPILTKWLQQWLSNGGLQKLIDGIAKT